MISNPIPWPNGARCACAITFDVDADSLIHIARPNDSFDRLYPITMGRYGPTVGVPRILDTYRRLGLKQSFFIPAWTMERYPDAVDAISGMATRSAITAIFMRTRPGFPARSSAKCSNVRSRSMSR